MTKQDLPTQTVTTYGIETFYRFTRIVEYLQNPPAPDTLLRLAEMIGVPLAGLLRTSEADFRESAEPVPMDDAQALSKWLHDHPRVLQRPIVVDEDQARAVIGRPPENVLELLST